MFHDEPMNAKTDTLTPGEDLSEQGIEQLTERLAVLREEIERTQAMIEKKQAGLNAAEAFFKTSSAG